MKYKYTGEGQGVPGLPNEVSKQEAKDLGLADVLKECIKAGIYKEDKKKPKEVANG